MADTFMQSFNQGLNLAHTIENDKRLQQAQQMQQQIQMMQLQKMAQEMADMEAAKRAYGDVETPGKFSGPPIEDKYGLTSGEFNQQYTPSTKGPSPAMQSALSMLPPGLHAAAKVSLQRTGELPKWFPKISQENTEFTLGEGQKRFRMEGGKAIPIAEGAPKSATELKPDNYTEVALARLFPGYMQDAKVREKAWNWYSTGEVQDNSGKKIAAADYVDGLAAANAQRRPIFPTTVIGQQPGGGGLVTWNPKPGSGGVGTVDIPKGVQITDKTPGAIPPAVQENISGATNAWRSLNIMEKAVEGTPDWPLVGHVAQAGAWAGFGKTGQQFSAARNNMKLSAQSLIKGIPSNFDIETYIETLPNWGEASSTNKERIKQSREILRTVAGNTISYYKHLNYAIPPEILYQAKSMGIDVDNIKPWSGSGDPLQEAIDKTAKQEPVDEKGPGTPAKPTVPTKDPGKMSVNQFEAWNLIQRAGTSSRAVKYLVGQGYDEDTAKAIVKRGIAEGKLK